MKTDRPTGAKLPCLLVCFNNNCFNIVLILFSVSKKPVIPTVSEDELREKSGQLREKSGQLREKSG